MSKNNLISCRDAVLDALVDEMGRRHDDPGMGWIERERAAVADAATAWAAVHGIAVGVTPEDVERIETSAVGHFDYASKLALYVAEMVVGGNPDA